MEVLARPLVDNNHRLFMALSPSRAHVTNPSFNRVGSYGVGWGGGSVTALYEGGMVDSGRQDP